MFAHLPEPMGETDLGGASRKKRLGGGVKRNQGVSASVGPSSFCPICSNPDEVRLPGGMAVNGEKKGKVRNGRKQTNKKRQKSKCVIEEVSKRSK